MFSAPRDLAPLRWWAALVHGRFELRWAGRHYVVDASYIDLEERIHLYCDGRHVQTVRRKAQFEIDDGVWIEAAVSKLGMKYVRPRRRDVGETSPLDPVEGTAESWRARLDRDHRAVSRVVGVVATLVLVAMLVLELPQLANLVGALTPHVGLPGFSVPALVLNGWQNALVVAAGGIAGLERGLSMKYNPWLDD